MKLTQLIVFVVSSVMTVKGFTIDQSDNPNSSTSTPVALLQVTPPSDGTVSVTPRPTFPAESTFQSQNSITGHVTPDSKDHVQRSSKSHQPFTDSRNNHSGQYQLIRGAPHQESQFRGEALLQREKETHALKASGRLDASLPRINEVDDLDDLIHGPKQPFPPAPGAGYIPAATSIGHAPPSAILGFQQGREVTRVEYVTADCFSNYMKITVQFNGSFDGLVYSTGYAHDTDCVYVNGSGQNRYEFSIRLNRCGTLGRPEFDLSANEVPDRNHFMWNTITVQYNPEIEEDWDEHFQVTCEYGYEFRRTVTFPVVGVEKNTASPYVVTLSPPQCYMEVRAGFSPNGDRLTGPVTVGDPLTLMIHMESESTEFDVAVSSCFAHNGAKKRLQLIDGNGCILKEQLMSPFRGIRSGSTSNHVALYAYFKAFRFTSSPALYLECDVHMCHGTCPAQRCHWKSLSKRSLHDFQPTVNPPLVSENISLFQALQVLQEAPETLDAGKLKPDEHTSSTFCLPVLALAALGTSFLAFLLLATVMCVFLCLRLRRMKATGDAPGMNNYMSSAYFDKEPTRKRL